MNNVFEVFCFAKVPRRTRILGIFTCGLFLIVSLVVVVPDYLSIGKERKKVASYEAELEANKLLNPLYEKLLEETAGLPSRKGLKIYEKKYVTRSDIAGLAEMFGEMASHEGLVLNGCDPSVMSMAGSGGLVGVNLRITGEFKKLRNFLVRIGEMPSLRNIGKINISAGPVSESSSVKLFLGLED